MEIAVVTGESKVVGGITTVVLPGDYVFNVETKKWLVILAQSAVFTPTTRSLPHATALGGVHCCRLARGFRILRAFA